MWEFSPDEVQTLKWVVVWLRWCAHYIVGEHDSDSADWVWFEANLEAGETYDGRHVRATSVMCDSKSADARLFTHRFFNEREMSYALLVDTARILQAVGDDIPVFPGWESVAHVLAFLKTEIRRTGSTTSSPLRCFLLSVCVCLRPPRIFPRPLNAALLHSPNCPCAPPRGQRPVLVAGRFRFSHPPPCLPPRPS